MASLVRGASTAQHGRDKRQRRKRVEEEESMREREKNILKIHMCVSTRKLKTQRILSYTTQNELCMIRKGSQNAMFLLQNSKEKEVNHIHRSVVERIL
ncbi:hypothetical protein TNIN_474051 [Trichonephila inaurata madagascariensis]|uniref:Uncharacterized protein n=1 Tax=Trichonephila inaurata madagascariensis TaxID=2747483 RepID=A0A8X6YDP0_9ARAC|nr:hypothetical protein TNIN_474051 [Trichonephila inaurata madagascariensis]